MCRRERRKEKKNRPLCSPALERRLGIFAGTGQCGGLSNIESRHYLCARRLKEFEVCKGFSQLNAGVK